MSGRFRRPVLSEAVRKYIKRFILDNNLEPGDLLPPETQLAEGLGVGRSSVREAMKSLQSLGIVDVRRGEGFMVREWNLDPVLETLSYGIRFNQAAFAELLQIRVWLEAATVSEVLQRITPQDIDELDTIMQNWAARFDTVQAWADLDEQFHAVLYRTLDNETFTNLLTVFWRAFETVDETLTGEADIRIEYRTHYAILEAIKTRDDALTRERLIDSFTNLQTRLRSTR
jgi:DNA-binding FadR family transcriptional regulator